MFLSMASKLAALIPQTSPAGPQIINPEPVSINSDINHETQTQLQSNENVKSILKPESTSLEPNDIRAKSKSNTPRKVQFDIIEGQQFGGRGLTEFSKTPARKSHTKKQLPIGMFDTESNLDNPLSDIDENNNSSVLDNLNSKKFMANSRLVRLVKRKKKRKEKEQRWLTMISPDVGLYNNYKNKTVSRTQSTQSNAINISVNNNDRFKSPSHYMSRGRRALYKAQQKQQNKGNINKHKITNATLNKPLLIQHTPIHKKVNAIAMRFQSQMSQNDFKNQSENDNISELYSDMEMKDNSHQNSADEYEENSDEMKIDNKDANIMGSEDDDLMLNVRNTFVPKPKGDITFDDSDTDTDSTQKITKTNAIPITNINNQMPMQCSQSPSQDINTEQRRLSFSITSTSPMNLRNNNNKFIIPFPQSPVPMQSNHSNSVINREIYTRSIGTQTEYCQCEIGIQAGNNNTFQSFMSGNSNTPQIIVTSNGNKYVLMSEENESANMGSLNNSLDISELTQMISTFHKHPIIGPYDFQRFENKHQWICGNDKCKNTKVLTYWISTKFRDSFCLCNVCANMHSNEINNNEIQQLQSLSLNIENVEPNTNHNRMRLKRKFSEAMGDKNVSIIKRRRMNGNVCGKRMKYRKGDIVCVMYNGIDEPAIILSCRYDANEKFYPSKYELCWLNWSDSIDDNERKGLCSITIESFECVKGCVTQEMFAKLFKNKSISKNGWKEMKKYRSDIYKKYFDENDRKKNVIPTKIRKKRRASIM